MDKRLRWCNELVGTLGDEVIPVVCAGHLVPVARSQVQWAQTDGDYVRLHVPGQSYLVREPLKCLAKRWAEHGFMRIHRFYLVYFPLVADVWRGPSGYNVRLGSGSNTVDLPVSRRHEQEVKQRWIHEHHYHGNGTSHAA